jgi:hypothetical protein
MGVDMPLCSRRAWITDFAVTHMPTPGGATTGIARCFSDTTDPTKTSYGWTNGRGDDLA